MSTTIVILARAPLPGRCKTRLIPLLGARGAARLQAQLLHDTVRRAASTGFPVTVQATPDGRHPAFLRLRRRGLSVRRQAGPGLGQRMRRAARGALGAAERVLLIGTDCPALSAQRMREAATALDRDPVVFVPALDGGYVLLGLKSPTPALFDPIAWGTKRVLGQSLQACRRHRLRVRLLPPLPDLDDATALRALRRQGRFRVTAACG